MRFQDVELDEEKAPTLSRPAQRKQKQATPVFQPNEPDWKAAQSDSNFALLQQNLDQCLRMIDDEVMKGYISNLRSLPVANPNRHTWQLVQEIHFFKITELVYQEDEFSVQKLATVFHSLSSKPCILVLMIRSDNRQNNFYLGVRSMDSRYSSGTMLEMLRNSLTGMFPGSRMEEYYDEDLKQDMDSLDAGCISSVTCVADFKQNKERMDEKGFIQGLEKYIDSLNGKAVTSILIAENLSHAQLMDVKKGYETIYTQIAPFANMQLNFSASDSKSNARGHSEGTAQNTSVGIHSGRSDNSGVSVSYSYGTSYGYGNTKSTGTNQSTADGTSNSKGVSDGTNSSVSDAQGSSDSFGGSIGGSVQMSQAAGIYAGVNASHGVNRTDTHTVSSGRSHTRSWTDSVSRTLTHGISHSHTNSVNYGTSKNMGRTSSYGSSVQQGVQYSTAETLSLMDSATWTDTLGTSQGITLQAKNMMLSSMNERIERHLKRIDECESAGMWEFAAYFIGESAAETETAANTYQSVVSGIQSGIERTAINSWTDDQSLEDILDYVKRFMHPVFIYQGLDYDRQRTELVTPAAMVSTNELAIHMGLPRHSIKGLPVVKHAVFAQEILRRDMEEKEAFALGNVFHLGMETNSDVSLDTDSLTMHTFVAGSTGSGKSNTVYVLLSEALEKQIPFLVIEPAKGEYKEIFPDIRCFGTNPNLGEMIRMNPFSFPVNIHVLEHIDRIVEIFNVCWPMYAAMPAVLKESIERAYVSAGWDLELSVNTKIAGLYPTFEDVLIQLHKLIGESAYSADTKGDYIGALATRLKSLTNGINGRIFSGNEMNPSELFDKSAILDISRVGSMETKALIMGMVVLKLEEYRTSSTKEMNAGLKHLTVLEEAHHLLKKTSSQQSQESANVQGKSVEMLTSAIAQMRTYGEGFIIVDQAPDLLDTAVIRNTNTKIVLRLPEGNDRKITGASMALSEKQILEISKLPKGVAAVYQNDWQEAVLCKMPRYRPACRRTDTSRQRTYPVSEKEQNIRLLHLLLQDNVADTDQNELRRTLVHIDVSAKIRRDLIMNLETKNMVFTWALADFISEKFHYEDIFKGTGDGMWNSLKELGDIMTANISDEFPDFNEKEMKQILYHICLTEHEKLPENPFIEQICIDFQKKEMGK